MWHGREVCPTSYGISPAHTLPTPFCKSISSRKASGEHPGQRLQPNLPQGLEAAGSGDLCLCSCQQHIGPCSPTNTVPLGPCGAALSQAEVGGWHAFLVTAPPQGLYGV